MLVLVGKCICFVRGSVWIKRREGKATKHFESQHLADFDHKHFDMHIRMLENHQARRSAKSHSKFRRCLSGTIRVIYTARPKAPSATCSPVYHSPAQNQHAYITCYSLIYSSSSPSAASTYFARMSFHCRYIQLVPNLQVPNQYLNIHPY